MSRKAIVLSLFVLALLAGLSVPAQADEAPAPAVSQTGCGLSFELAPAPEQAGLCPATRAENPLLVSPFGGRTCRCSCGQPCKTDADCGPGGICSGGITCC